MKFKLSTHTQEEEAHLNYNKQIVVIVILDLIVLFRYNIVLFNNCSINIKTDFIQLF